MRHWGIVGRFAASAPSSKRPRKTVQNPGACGAGHNGQGSQFKTKAPSAQFQTAKEASSKPEVGIAVGPALGFELSSLTVEKSPAQRRGACGAVHNRQNASSKPERCGAVQPAITIASKRLI